MGAAGSKEVPLGQLWTTLESLNFRHPETTADHIQKVFALYSARGCFVHGTSVSVEASIGQAGVHVRISFPVTYPEEEATITVDRESLPPHFRLPVGVIGQQGEVQLGYCASALTQLQVLGFTITCCLDNSLIFRSWESKWLELRENFQVTDAQKFADTAQNASEKTSTICRTSDTHIVSHF